jgi:single stranded DNA-binding protein
MRNYIQLICRLTKDPESKPVGDKKLCIASAAYNVTREKSWFIDINSWDKSAEKFLKYKKGDLVIVQGSLDIQSWEDKNGNRRTKPLINCRESMRIPKDNSLDDSAPASYQEEVVSYDPIGDGSDIF